MGVAPFTIRSETIKTTCTPIVRDADMDEMAYNKLPDAEFANYTWQVWRRGNGMLVLHPPGINWVVIIDGPIIITAKIVTCNDCGRFEGDMYVCRHTGLVFCSDCIDEYDDDYTRVPMFDGV